MTEFMKSDHQELNNLFSNEELSALNEKVEESYYQQQTETPTTEPVIKPEEVKPETSRVEVKPEEVKPVSTPVTEPAVKPAEVKPETSQAEVKPVSTPVTEEPVQPVSTPVTEEPVKPVSTPVKEEPVQPQPIQQPVPEGKLYPMEEPEKVVPTNYQEEPEDTGTLAAFMRQREYEQSDEYKQKQAEEAQLENKLHSAQGVTELKKIASLSGDALNHISILDTTKIAKPAPTVFKGSNPTYQVTLNQSAYIAHMEGLKFPDVFNINSSIGNDYESALKKYRTYYEKVSYNSIGINSFEEFAAMTSLFDVETIAFGILNQTFPGKIKYNITCRNCQETMEEVPIANDKLIEVKNDDVYKQVAGIINSIDNPEKANKLSLINKVERIQLEESMTILDIRIPTIEDHLNILAELRSVTTEEEMDRFSSFLLFIKTAYVLDAKETLRAGKPIFIEYKDRASILNIVRNFSIKDAGQASEYIESKEEENRISYAIKSFPCRNCHEEIGEVNVDIENLLFLESVQRFIK